MIRLPDYAKMSQILVGLLAFFYILYIGKTIIVPLAFSAIIAILLNPVVNWMYNKGCNRLIAIILTILLFCFLVFAVFYFIGSQVSMFREALPSLEEKFKTVTNNGIDWVSRTFKVPLNKIKTWIDTKKTSGIDQAGAVVGSTLLVISGKLLMVLLIPVYAFLFLFYKPLLLDFIARAFVAEKHHTVAEVLFNTKTLVQSYLVGLLIEMVIVSTLNSTTLLIIGVDYAIVLGVIGAILNLIPYIGGMIAISLPMLMAFVTGTPMSALFVLMGYIVIQIIDNNFLVPMIVASKVQVNALISIVVVLIGGALWGVAGMFLSIPVTAILKVICDRVEPLKPIGFLIGDTMPRIGEDIFRFHLLQRAADANKKRKHLKK